MLLRVSNLFIQKRCITNNTIFALSSGRIIKFISTFTTLNGLFSKGMENVVYRLFGYLAHKRKPPLIY